MKLSIKLTITLLCLFISATAFAKLYKSVDADGNVTYSQSPPETGNYETIKVKKYKPVTPDASQRSLKAIQSIKQGADARKENDLVKNELKKNSKIQEENCNIAKKNLRLFTVYKRLKNEKGEYYRVPDDERERRIKAAKENIKQFCK